MKKITYVKPKITGSASPSLLRAACGNRAGRSRAAYVRTGGFAAVTRGH